MSDLPRVSGSGCVAALTWAGYHLKWQQGHHLFLRKNDPVTQVVVPDLPQLDRATLAAIIHHAGLTIDEFLELL